MVISNLLYKLSIMYINQKRLIQDVDYLTSIFPYRNYKNISSLDKAAQYIQQEFQKAKLPIITQSWMVNGNEYKNIIAHYQPHKKQRLILGAHYDVFKEQAGADDNAIGVAAVLEIARMTHEHQPQLDYGIDFIGFSLEEPPFFKKKEMGSYIHAQSIEEQKQDFIGMIALEMIGYYEGKPGALTHQKELFVSGIKRFHSFNRKISSLLRAPHLLTAKSHSLADDNKNAGPSDHRNYWPLDIPAVMIIGSGGNGNPNYHKSTDTIDTLDFNTMRLAVESIAYAVFNF